MDDQAIAGARNYATETANTAAKYNSQGYTVADELRKAIGERYGESDIAKQTSEARGTFLAQAPQDRMAVQGMVDEGNILSPGQQQAVLAAKRGSALVPLMGANLVDSAAFGTMEDLINAGTNAFKAQGSYAMSLAQQAQQTYQNLMDEAIKRAQMKQIEEEMAMKQAMAPFEQQYKQAQIANLVADTNKTSNSGTKTPKAPKYDEVDIANYANSVKAGRMKINQVPQDIRGDVDALVVKLKQSEVGTGKYGTARFFPDALGVAPFGRYGE